MNHETQVGLIRRINHHRSAGRGTDCVDSSMSVATSVYTDRERFDDERELFRSEPLVVGLSGLLPSPNSYATVDVGDRSVILTRGIDGLVTAMLNVCRHRGAELVSGCGSSARLTCPYHGWTYYLDGSPSSRRREQYFADKTPDGLICLPVLEQYGMLWLSADPQGSVPPEPLCGAEVEIEPLDLGGYRLFETRSFTRPINWKLVVDTFCESYHVSSLHKNTLSPMIHSDFALFDEMGPHGRMVSARRSIADLDKADPDSWSLLEHTTILWFLAPNSVLIHQQDHVELYQARPGTHPGEAHLVVSLYVPPGSTRPEAYWKKNLDLLIEVTDAEDFTTAAGMQRGFDSGAQSEVVFGQNEPALQHYHRSLDRRVDLLRASRQ